MNLIKRELVVCGFGAPRSSVFVDNEDEFFKFVFWLLQNVRI